MTTLAETLSQQGKTLETVATYVQQYVNEHWQDVWQSHLPEIELVYQQSGDPAYGLYSRKLFGPLEQELRQAGLTCDPALPGGFSQSREAGPEDARERRFWCVLRQENGEALGALVTRYFHDHTQLRIPQTPLILALPETDALAFVTSIKQSTLPGR